MKRFQKTSEVEIDVDVKHETDKAYLVSDGDKEAWIPKSAVSDYCEEDGRITSIIISERLAIEKGFA